MTAISTLLKCLPDSPYKERLAAHIDDMRKNARIGEAINRAATDLPEQYDLHIEVEKHAGTVRLYLPDGEEASEEFGGDYFYEQIDNAINFAIAHAEKGGAACN